ncbi:ParB N-terminal domain-containing protein [Paenibacillus pabuli]|uniref:ParB N-terminal domain-containing protein n=1 Tax=Paenibacillus pabuli TaxID=1472 RepID=UPI003CEC986D
MAQEEVISLKKLYFDPLNPRLPKSLIGCEDELKVIDYLNRHGNIIELMESIGQIGYSKAEPLLVVPKKDSPGDFIVVEGNRRLAALKLLSNPELTILRKNSIAEAKATAKFIPTDIPVILYNSRDEILDYLGYRHITGVKDWGSLEKARYLDQLYKIHIDRVGRDRIYSVLSKMIGSRPDYVARLHTALKLYELANDDAYYDIEIEENDFNFSWITTALSFSKTIDFLGLSSPGDSSLTNLNKDNYSQLFTWLFDPKKRKVVDSRQISELSKILESKPALEKLKSGSTISEALLFTSAPNEGFYNFIDKAKQNLQNAKNMIETLNTYPENSISVIEDIEKICKSIKGALHENFIVPKSNAGLDGLTPDQIQQLLKLVKEQGE